MALGTVTVLEACVGDGPVNFDLISFPGDDDYATGGTAAFQAAVRAVLGKGNVEVIGVIPQDCGGLNPVYDKANDKLKVYAANNTEASAAADLSTTTFNLMVLSK